MLPLTTKKPPEHHDR